MQEPPACSYTEKSAENNIIQDMISERAVASNRLADKTVKTEFRSKQFVFIASLPLLEYQVDKNTKLFLFQQQRFKLWRVRIKINKVVAVLVKSYCSHYLVLLPTYENPH